MSMLLHCRQAGTESPMAEPRLCQGGPFGSSAHVEPAADHFKAPKSAMLPVEHSLNPNAQRRTPTVSQLYPFAAMMIVPMIAPINLQVFGWRYQMDVSWDPHPDSVQVRRSFDLRAVKHVWLVDAVLFSCVSVLTLSSGFLLCRTAGKWNILTGISGALAASRHSKSHLVHSNSTWRLPLPTDPLTRMFSRSQIPIAVQGQPPYRQMRANRFSFRK